MEIFYSLKKDKVKFFIYQYKISARKRIKQTPGNVFNRSVIREIKLFQFNLKLNDTFDSVDCLTKYFFDNLNSWYNVAKVMNTK